MIAFTLVASLALATASQSQTHDTTLARARAVLDDGRPWEATRILAPVIADPARRTPDALLVAATAASRWSGWAEVRRLLRKESWLDSLFGSAGRRLLVRADLEQDNDSLALAGALQGLRSRRTDSIAAADLTVALARALDRAEARDSAARVYQTAADRLPLVADWLRLRAVAVTDDSVARARLVARLADPLVRRRVPWADAAARERGGDLAGAARGYAALGSRIRVLQLRLTADSSDSARATVRKELLALLKERPSAADVRGAVGLLDRTFPRLTASEQLIVARSAGSALPARAADAYRRALAAGLGTSADRFEYAAALFRLAQYGDAAFQFNLVTRPRALAASAAYQRARALVRDGQMSEGTSALLEVSRRYAADTAAASSALFLLADLATDRQDDAEARSLFRRVAIRYPSSRFAPSARFRAAIIAYTAGRFLEAATELDELVQRYPASDDAPAAVYWAGRAFVGAGDTASAVRRWEKNATRDSLSYYGSRSARRLGRAPWTPAPIATDVFTRVPSIDSTIRRAALLERIGLASEAQHEYARLANLNGDSADAEQLLAAANALRRADRASEAITLARRALARGAAADARVYRLLYPVIHRDALLAETAARRLDPSFVAALIRQESRFNPAATSPVGARGLMQIMPQVGAGVAQSLGYPVWDPVLLYQPDVSLQLGITHLAELAERYATPVRMLAAYNAGASRVTRWDQKLGVGDPELFAERIPFVETRDYVRIIQRNQELYQALYQ